MQQTEHLYIVTDERILSGEPIIVGTRTPVHAIIELWRQGLAPETIPNHLPHLTLAQVFDALSYYSDHQSEINSYAERNASQSADRTAGAQLVNRRFPPVVEVK